MRRARSIIEFLLVLVSIASCSVMQIKKTQDLTERLVKSLYQKNGNAFYLSSTHASFSTVWTHTEDMVIVYRLQKGKRKQMLSFMEKGIVQFAKIDPEDIEKELYQKCALELDGDVFGFIIDVDGNMLSEDYAIDIQCMKQSQYESEFLGTIKKDIQEYKLWNIND